MYDLLGPNQDIIVGVILAFIWAVGISLWAYGAHYNKDRLAQIGFPMWLLSSMAGIMYAFLMLVGIN